MLRARFIANMATRFIINMAAKQTVQCIPEKYFLVLFFQANSLMPLSSPVSPS
jgi:hypothetical protein